MVAVPILKNGFGQTSIPTVTTRANKEFKQTQEKYAQRIYPENIHTIEPKQATAYCFIKYSAHIVRGLKNRKCGKHSSTLVPLCTTAVYTRAGSARVPTKYGPRHRSPHRLRSVSHAVSSVPYEGRNLQRLFKTRPGRRTEPRRRGGPLTRLRM